MHGSSRVGGGDVEQRGSGKVSADAA